MGKKSRLKNRQERKQERKNRFQVEFKARPFANMDAEKDLVALRELLPSAYMQIRTSAEYGERTVMVCSLLPGMSRALIRQDGVAMVGMQVSVSSADLSHDLAAALLSVSKAKDQSEVHVDINAPAPALEEIWDQVVEPLQIEQDVSFWFSESMRENPEVAQAIVDAKKDMTLTKAVPGVEGAFWVQFNRPFVRLILAQDENRALDALARLHVLRELSLGQDTKLAGAFRSAGLLIPVWELPENMTASDLEQPLTEFMSRFTAALQNTEELTYQERQARAGLINRQVILK